MKASLRFGLVALAVTLVAGSVFWLLWRDAESRRAVALSALTAVVVQLAAFSVARRWLRTNLIAGWGLGVIIRFGALAAYAFLVVGALDLPQAVALISLATFLFLSTLLEPLLLKP